MLAGAQTPTLGPPGAPNSPAEMAPQQARWRARTLASLPAPCSSVSLRSPAQPDTRGIGGTGLLFSTRACVCAKSLQTCLTLCNPMDCSPEGSSVHPISQARILEWVAMPSSRGLNPCLLGLLHWQMGSFPLSHLGSPCPFWKNTCLVITKGQ